ncbi:MAG TPA: phytanoyl-CoA dioxygenase family protein [Gemmatimonadaceae bacterium]|jgi:ectoine hydroxylase-related dioxygenase (phytanoyl-CoA dioxygenase family)
MNIAEQFDRDGWSIVRGVVSRDDVAAMIEVFTAILLETADWPSSSDGIVAEVAGASRAHASLARITTDPRFGAPAAEALGAARVQLLQDSLLYKPARTGATVEWHQDHTYVGFLCPPRVVTVRVALLPESTSNGCMHVVSGSHRWGSVGDIRALTESGVQSLLPLLSDEQRRAADAAIAVELEPGDISIHHCLTLHGSGPNRADAAQRTILLRMFDSQCRLDFARLPVGAERHFPLEPDGSLSLYNFPLVFDSSR